MDIRIDEDENQNRNENENENENDRNGNGAGNIENAVRFTYCRNCEKGYKLPRGDLTPNLINCAICNFQAITVTKPSGKSHTICPQCFKYVRASIDPFNIFLF